MSIWFGLKTVCEKLPQHEPMLKAERILMVDLAATKPQANGAFPSVNTKEG
jgi:hypothetical protein